VKVKPKFLLMNAVMPVRLRKVLILFGLASTFFLCGSALAVPFTWTDVINPDTVIGSRQLSVYSYSHNLTANPTPFVPIRDWISQYTLTLRLSDDDIGRDEWVGAEHVIVNLPGFISDGIYDFSNEFNEFGLSIAGLVNLNISGEFNVTLISWGGDFYFGSSTLTASGHNNSNTARVPEPAMMVLFGTGLVMFGFIGRKFKQS